MESIGITPTGQQHPTPETSWHGIPSTFFLFRFDGQHYEVAAPRRDERPQLPNNLPIAKERLASTERKVMKDNGISRGLSKGD